MIDFELYPGETHALVGENGAGKTTLMRILYGQYKADSGTIEVDPDGAGTYFAVSDMYEDVVYDMTLVGDDVIYWGGEYDYYQKMA